MLVDDVDENGLGRLLAVIGVRRCAAAEAVGWEEAIFGRISHHPFGPQCSREFATLHISCRKQQFPSLYLARFGSLAGMWDATAASNAFCPKRQKMPDTI